MLGRNGRRRMRRTPSSREYARGKRRDSMRLPAAPSLKKDESSTGPAAGRAGEGRPSGGRRRGSGEAAGGDGGGRRAIGRFGATSFVGANKQGEFRLAPSLNEEDEQEPLGSAAGRAIGERRSSGGQRGSLNAAGGSVAYVYPFADFRGRYA